MLSPRARIGDYEIVRRTASGATCDVYEARDVSTGGTVAIKSLRPDCCNWPEIMARFVNEAKLLRELRHPHLVNALDSGVTPGGPPYMVLEWLPLDLQRALNQSGRFEPGIAARVSAQLADVLATLHGQGIVHRDLKPANVLLAGENPSTWIAKLADLGLAKRLPDATAPEAGVPISTARNASLGTWDYMAPEQWFTSKNAGPEVDVYALGVLLFQMLAGQLPFVADEERQLMYLHVIRPPPMNLLEGMAPPGLTALVGRMLAKSTADRPAMRDALLVLKSL